MRPVKIITDSTCDLNREDLEKFEIEVAPLNVVFDDKSYLDGVEIVTKELYKKVEETKVLPKTTAVSPARYLEVYKKWIDKDYDIIVLGISSKLSGSYQNACLAAKEMPEGRVFVLDSLNLSSAIGLQLLKIQQLKEKGLSAVEIVEQVRNLPSKVKCSFSIDTMEYLYKGGRCSGISYFFGRIFHIHPIISVVDGGMIVHKTPRGKMTKALDIMINEFKEDYDNGLVDVDTIMITHSESDEYADYIFNELAKFVDKRHLMITRAGCVISSHCGPKTIGILYITK